MLDKSLILTINTISDNIQKVFKISKGRMPNLQANLHNRNWYVSHMWWQNMVNLKGVLVGGETAVPP